MKTFFLAKIYLYYLNAYTDAYLSNKLIKYAKRELKYKNLDDRLKKLVGSDGNKSKEELVGYAYTYYFWNGFYDYMYARLFEKYFGWKWKKNLKNLKILVNEYRKELKMDYAYVEFDKKNIILITPLLQIIIKKLYLYDYFVKRNDVEDLKHASRKVIVESMKLVQKVNIVSNGDVGLNLKNNNRSGLKEEFVYKGSLLVENRNGFINGCVNSLNSASRWDGWFIKLLNLKFG